HSPFFLRALFVLALFLLAGLYGLWLAHSEFANVASRVIVNHPRVRAELGSDVRVPLVVGWNLNDVAFLFGLIGGQEGWGYLTVRMTKSNGQWHYPELRVHNVTEEHVINLSSREAASKDDLHADARLYLVALGHSAQPEVDAVATHLQDDFGI